MYRFRSRVGRWHDVFNNKLTRKLVKIFDLRPGLNRYILGDKFCTILQYECDNIHMYEDRTVGVYGPGRRNEKAGLHTSLLTASVSLLVLCH